MMMMMMNNDRPIFVFSVDVFNKASVVNSEI
jgi:hypothetical protein